MLSSATTCNTCGSTLDPSRHYGRCAACLFAEAFEPVKEGGGLGTIGGHELIEEIARGGMGVVYRARQGEPAREVALKTLRGAELDSPAALVRFRQEARAMADLEHPSILPVFTFGEHGGIPFFTMKLATGGTLAQRLGDYAGKWREISELVARVADAVQHAHAHAVLHRDLKPANILFDESGRAFVSDFGLAKLLEATDGALTHTMAVLGTPHYLAPEIAAHDARAATTASDVWSLGVILYELLAQRRPFAAESIPALLRVVTDTEPAPMRGLPNVGAPPRDLATIAVKALTKEPAQRYASAAALADDLRRWREGRPILARPVSPAEKLGLWARRNPAIAALCALLVLCVVSAAFLLVAAYRETNEALRTALLKEAQFQTATGRVGQRFDALQTLQRAAAIRPDTDLINACAAALARADLRWIHSCPAVTRSEDQPEFSPDLEQFAAPDYERGGFSLRATLDSRELRHFPASKPASAFAFSPDGRTIAARLSSNVVQIWRVDGKVPVAEVPGARAAKMEGGMSASFSVALGAWAVIAADGAIVKVALDGTLSVLVPASGKVAQSILFDPKGERLAVSDQEGVDLWKVGEARKLWAFPQKSMLPAMAWHPQGDFLAITSRSGQREVIVLRAANGSFRSRLSGTTQSTLRLAFHPTLFILAAAGGDSMVRLWDYRDGSMLLVAPGTPRTLRWSADGKRLASGMGWQTLGILQFECDAVFREFGGFFQFRTGTIGSELSATPDGRLLVTTGSIGVDFWSTATRRHVGQIRDVNVAGAPAFVTPDSKWVAYAQPEAGFGIARRALAFRSAADPLSIGAEERPAGSWKTTLHDITRGNAWLVRHWDSGRWEQWPEADASRATPLLPTGPDTQVFSPDLRWTLPVAHHEAVRGTDRSTGKAFAIPGPITRATAFSPDGRWLLLRGIEENALVEVGTWRQRARWPAGGETYGQRCFAFSSDSKRLAISYANESLKIFSVPEAREVITLTPSRPLDFRRVVFSPDGRKLWAMGVAARIFEWDLAALDQELKVLGIPWEQ